MKDNRLDNYMMAMYVMEKFNGITALSLVCYLYGKQLLACKEESSSDYELNFSKIYDSLKKYPEFSDAVDVLASIPDVDWNDALNRLHSCLLNEVKEESLDYYMDDLLPYKDKLNSLFDSYEGGSKEFVEKNKDRILYLILDELEPEELFACDSWSDAIDKYAGVGSNLTSSTLFLEWCDRNGIKDKVAEYDRISNICASMSCDFDSYIRDRMN